MYLSLPSVIAFAFFIIAFAFFKLNGTNINMMDDAYPLMVTQVVPTVLMVFFAAVMFDAILSSFNFFLNSTNTMYIMDIYKDFTQPDATDEQMVQHGKNWYHFCDYHNDCRTDGILSLSGTAHILRFVGYVGSASGTVRCVWGILL